ncbi:mucin-17-like isoform X2 [Ochlerotatus camptorhynchus]|uniref:mucin-17-like isoform X2 n=1 Tax=Ochlerotatus camptorhynchus TaxID=644619 RepID=UPI0031E22EF1
MALLNGARLSVLRKNSDDVTQEVLIRTSQIKIGSEVNCTIRLKSELAEKLHCKVFVKNEKVFIANYSLKHPISVDGKLIPKRAILNDGCLIEICRTRFRWTFDTTLLQARTEKVKKAERTPTSSKLGKPRRTTIVRKKQIIEHAEHAVGSSGRKSGPKKSQKTPTYTLPKNNKQLLKNIKKRFTMHSVMVDHNSDDDEEIDDEDHDHNESTATESNIDHDISDTPRKLAPPDISKNNTPFYTPDLEKENQTPVAVGKTPGTPKAQALQLENSAMMILSYTPVVGPRSKVNVAKTPLSSNKKTTHALRSGFLTPKNNNISTVATTLNSPNVSKVGSSMYLIDLTTPNSKNSSYASNRSDQSFSSPAGLIDLTTPPSKKSKTPSSAIAKSSQKGLLRSALKNARQTPLSALRSGYATGTPKHVPKYMLEDSVSKSPKTPGKSIRTLLTPSSSSKNKTRSQMTTPIMNKTFDSPVTAHSQKPQTPQHKGEHGGETDTPKEPPVMTTDELFDTLVGRQSIKKTYSRKSESPKKLPSPLVPVEGSCELPKTDIDIWVESVVAAVTSPESLDAESFMKMPNRTTQVRSSQYSDITPHESFTDAPVAVAIEMPPTDKSQENTSPDEVSAIISEGEIEKHDKPNPAWTRRSHTPLASKIVRSLGYKRQTIGNFFTNMFGKLTVSPVTRVSITGENSDEVTEETHQPDLDRSSESEISEEEYHDSESDQQIDVAVQSEGINPSPKLRQSLRDTRRFIGNALTSLNTSKLTLDNSVEIDESLLLSETYDDNVVNQSALVEENYDLTDLSARPETAHLIDVPCAVTLDEHSQPSTSARKSARKVVHPDFRSEISPTDNDTQPLSPRVVHQSRTSVSLSTPSVRKNIRQTLDVDISPLAVPLQLTPVKDSRKSVINCSMTDQEVSTCVIDEPHQAPVTAARESVLVDTSPDADTAITEKRKSFVSRRSSRKSIVHNSISDTGASTEESKDHSSVSDTESSDVNCPVETTESATPLRSRLSMRVSRNSTVNVEAQQLEPAEEWIRDGLHPSADVSSVDHIINTSATESTTPNLEEGTVRGEVQNGNDASVANNSGVDNNELEQSINLEDAEEVTSTRRSRSIKIHSTVPTENTEQITSNQSTTECVASKNISHSRRATFSSSTPLQEEVGMKLASPEPTLGLQMMSSAKRITRKSLAVTAASLPNASRTISTMIMSEPKLSLRGIRLPASLRLSFHDPSMDDLSSSPDKTLTENPVIDEGNTVQQIGPETISPTSNSDSPDNVSSAAGDNEELMEANHDSLSTSTLEAVDAEVKNLNEDKHQDQSTVSEMVSNTPVRRGRSSLRQSRTSTGKSDNDRLSASMGKPVKNPTNGTPIFRKAIFAMCTPSRTSGYSDAPGLRAMAAGQVTKEMTQVRTESKPGTRARSTRRSTIGAKESTPANRNPEIDAQNEFAIVDVAASIRSPNKDSEQTSMPTEGLRPDSSPIIYTPRTRGRALKTETPIAAPVLIDFEFETGIKTPASVRKSQLITSAATSSADKSISIQIVEEIHDSIVEQVVTKSEVFTPFEEFSENVATSSKIESMPEHSIEVGSPLPESCSRKSTVSARQSIVNAETDPQNESTISEVSENIETPSMYTSEQTSMSTDIIDEPATVPSTVEHTPLTRERLVSGKTSGSTRKPLLTTPAGTRSANESGTMLQDQILDSFVDQQDASITEPEVFTPSEETSVMRENATDASKVASFPERISPARASRSSRRSTISTNDSILTCSDAEPGVSNEFAVSDVPVIIGSSPKQTEMWTGGNLQTSISASPSVIRTPRVRASATKIAISAVSPVSVDFEHGAAVKTPASVRKSLLISRSANKRATVAEQISESIVEQPDASINGAEAPTPSKESFFISEDVTQPELAIEDESSVRASLSMVEHTSESIVEQPDVSIIEPEVLTPSKESFIIDDNVAELEQLIEDGSPLRASFSTRSTIAAKESTPARQNIVDVEPGAQNATVVLNVTPSIQSSEQMSMLAQHLHKSVATSSPVIHTPRTRRRTLRMGTSFATPLLAEIELGTSIKTPVSVSHVQVHDSAVEQQDVSIAEPEVLTPSKQTFVISGNTASVSEVGSTPEYSSPARASRFSKRSTIVSLDADKRATMVQQLAESVDEQPDASTTEPEVFTPSKDTSVKTGNAVDASKVVSTSGHISPTRPSRSSRRSTIGTNYSKLSCRDAEPDELAVSDVTESIDATPKQTGISTGNLQTYMSASPSVIQTPRVCASATKIATSTVSTPLSYDFQHGGSVKTPASVRKSLLISRSANKRATMAEQLSESIVEQPDASINESEAPMPSKESFFISENVTRASLLRTSTIGAKESTPAHQNIVDVKHGDQNEAAGLSMSLWVEHSQKSVTNTPRTRRRTSIIGNPFATSLLANVEHGTSIKTPASVRKSLLTTPSGTRSFTESSKVVFHEQMYDSIVRQQDASIREPEVFKPAKETSVMTGSAAETSKVASTPEQSTESVAPFCVESKDSIPTRASRSSRRSTIGAMESKEIVEHAIVQVSSPHPQSPEQDLKESSIASSPTKHTPRTSGRLSKIGTPALVVEKGVRTHASVRKSLPTTPTKHLQEKFNESVNAQHDITISKDELLTPVKEISTVEYRTVEFTPELTYASRDLDCVVTPALDTIFKTPLPIRGTRTPQAAVKRTPASTNEEKQLSKSVASGTPVQETRSTRKSSHELDADDRKVSISPQIEAVHDDDLINQTDELSISHDTNIRRSTRFSTSALANDNAEHQNSRTSEYSLSSSMMVGLCDSPLTVTDANITAAPFVIEETPIISVGPSVNMSNVSGKTSSVDVCPDLLKHLCERVITLEHELDILAGDSANSVNVLQSLDETAANCTDTLMGIQKLLETPSATSTLRKKLRSSTIPTELRETSNLDGVEQLLKTPIGKKLLRTPETVSVGTSITTTAHSELDETAQDSIGYLDGIQKLMETPVSLAVRRKKLQKNPAIDLSSSYHSTLNTTVDLEDVGQFLKTPTVSSVMKIKLTRTTPDISIQLEGVHELLKTPVAVADDANERLDNSPVAMEGIQRRLTPTASCVVSSSDRSTLRTSVYSIDSSTHLEGAQRLLETPVTSAVSPNDTFSLDGVHQLLRTPLSTSTVKRILKSPTSPDSTCAQQPSSTIEGVKRTLDTPSTADLEKAERLLMTPVGHGSNLEGVEQMFKTPIALSTARKNVRSTTKVPMIKLDESSNFEGIQQMLQTPVAFISKGRLLRSPANNSVDDSSINLEGMEQLLKSQTASTPIVKKTTETPVPSIGVRKSLRSSSAIKLNYTDLDTSSSHLEGVQKLLLSPVATPISPEKQLDATKETTLNKTVDLEGVQQLLKTPDDASVAKKVDSDKSICLESVQQLFKTPNPISVVKRKERSVTTAAVVNRCNLDDSDALEGIQNLLKTPEVSSTIKKRIGREHPVSPVNLNDTPINMEGLKQLLETPMDTEKKLGSTSAVNDDTVILDGMQQVLGTTTSTRGNESQQHDRTSNLEGLQSMLSTPMALSSTGKTEPKSTSAVDGLDQNSSRSTPVPVVTNESVSLEGIQHMLETPIVMSTGKNILKRAIVNPIRGTQSNTSKNTEGIQQLLVKPTIISGQKPSEDSPNDSNLEGIQQLLLTPAMTSVKVDVSVSDAVTEVSTPSNTRLRRKLYTKNDPEDRTPESVKSPEMHPVTSKDYLNILIPIAAKDTRLGKKMAKSTVSDNTSNNTKSSADEPIRKNPSRTSKKHNSLTEEVLAGASPEVTHFKPKQPKVVEEPTPITPVEVVASTSSKSDSGIQDLSAGRRKVMFNENLQIKEINSPAPVGDIILKVSRGRGRNAQKVVQVIVEEPREQPMIKPARRATRKDAEKEESNNADEQPSVQLVDAEVTNNTTMTKRSRRGTKRVMNAIEVSNDDINSQPKATLDRTNEESKGCTVPEVNDKSEAEQVVKRARRAVTKSKPEAKKTSTRTRSKKLDTVEVLHNEAAVSADQVEFSANQEHSNATSTPTPERSQCDPQKNIRDITSPFELTHDEQSAPEPVAKISEDDQVVEPLSGRGKRVAKHPTTRSNRAKSSKKNVSNEDSTTDAHTVMESVEQESTVTTNIDLEASDSAAEPLEEKAAPKRTKRATVTKSRQRRAVATKPETSDARSSSGLTQIQEEQILDTPILHTPMDDAPVVEQAAADSTSHDEPETIPVKRGRGRNTRKPATKSTDEPIAAMKEASPMPPPPVMDETSEKLTSKHGSKARKKPVVQVEPEVHTTEESLNESRMARTMLPATHTSTPLLKIEEEKPKSTRGRTRKIVNPTVAALIAEESTPNRRSPRSRQAGSESRTQDSQNATDAEEPKIKRSRTRTAAKINLNDDSKDHPPTDENISTATEDGTSNDKKPSRIPAKRGRGKTDQTKTEPVVVKEVAPKRIRKLPAKLQVTDSVYVPTSNDTETDTDKADPEIPPSRSRRGGTKHIKQKADTSSTPVVESNDNTNDVEKKPSKGRKPAVKRPATRKKTAHVPEEEADADGSATAKEIQKDEEPVVESFENATATTSRRRPLRSRK